VPTTTTDLKNLINPLYKNVLSVNQGFDIPAILNELLSNDFHCISTLEVKNKTAFIEQVEKQRLLLPDLKWEPQAIFQEDQHVIVRSLVSGSPKGDFFGMHMNGEYSFKVTSFEIYKFENRKICEMHHLEDWISAIKQLNNP
jgi:predicted ester cyclase